jgi:PadR family transcriptional regulator, regulatory protein PadR
MRPSKELIGASTNLLVLAALARRPSYGYEIVRRINEAAGGVFTWQEGTIYPLLHKLQKDRLVSAQWREAENGRKRKYYTVTPRGRSALQQHVSHWHQFHEMIVGLTGAAHAVRPVT